MKQNIIYTFILDKLISHIDIDNIKNQLHDFDIYFICYDNFELKISFKKNISDINEEHLIETIRKYIWHS